MKTLPCLVAVALAGVAAGAVACGGDSSGPSGPQAASVTGIAGDSQFASTGAQLGFPLSLTVLGSNGQPVQGVRVTWTSNPANRVTFQPDTTPSDASGIVTTQVTAGTTPDTVLVQAHVPGVQQPVDFHVLIVDPCAFAIIHTLGNSQNGVLTTHDCRVGQSPFFWYYDFYALSLPAQAGVTINMNATYDTYLDVWRDLGTQGLLYMGFNDDISGANLNSRFEAILAPGDYILGANTADTSVTGPYILSSVARAQTIENCPELWVSRGVVITDNISATDCPDTTGTGSYGDTLRIVALRNSTVKIALRSVAVNANLRLFQRVFSQSLTAPDSVRLVASNDDSSGTTNDAYITYTVPTGPGGAVLLEIFAGTSGTGQTGAYTLDISASTTLSGSERAAGGAAPRSAWGFSLGQRVIPQLGLRRRR